MFASGDSAGANIAHHAAARAEPGGGGHLALAGCVLLWPYFGGERRTASEAACPADVFLTLPLYDQMWRLALPPGATRDHPAGNPFGPDSPALGAADLPPLLVAAGDGDMIIDRIRDYVAWRGSGPRGTSAPSSSSSRGRAMGSPSSSRTPRRRASSSASCGGSCTAAALGSRTRA